MNINDKINYVEFQTRDIEASKKFFTAVFGWSFKDYGPDYASFSDQGVNGGLFKSGGASTTATGGALVVMYSDTLEAVQERVAQAGGTILKPIFSFPGGRRFQFTEPSGNELAVWSDVEA